MSDRIEKHVVLKAPLERVWRAISDSNEFGRWFGVDFGGAAFVAGQAMKGRIVPTTVDPEIAKLQEPHQGVPVEFRIESVDPKRLFSFRWHPFAVDKGVDYSKEPMTLVTFELEEVSGGTKLTITESGFENIPLERRAKAFASNEGGWAAQAKLIAKYVQS